MKKCRIIINPVSGKNKKIKNYDDIQKLLLNYEYETKFIFTEYKAHATKIVKELEEIDLVISIGGDGTFNEIMAGNLERKDRILLAHIPFGTANDIGAMYGYKRNLLKNFKLLLEGTVKKIDICTINNKPFTYCAAFGKFTNVSYDTPKKMKKKYGYLAYLIYGLKEIQGKTKLYPLTYSTSNKLETGEYSFILISNANRIAGINKFYTDVLLDDNKFEILFCNLTTRREIIRAIYHLAKSDITKVPGFKFYKASEIKIKFLNSPEKGWSLDGEEYNNNIDNFNIEIIQGVEILIPNKNIKNLFRKEE